MTSRISRTVAAAGAVVLLSAVGALTINDDAHAVTVAGPSWDQNGVDVTLTSAETSSAISQGVRATGSICTAAINQAIAADVPFPDMPRTTCAEAVAECASWARTAPRNNALSATRLYPDGSHLCLAR